MPCAIHASRYWRCPVRTRTALLTCLTFEPIVRFPLLCRLFVSFSITELIRVYLSFGNSIKLGEDYLPPLLMVALCNWRLYLRTHFKRYQLTPTLMIGIACVQYLLFGGVRFYAAFSALSVLVEPHETTVQHTCCCAVCPMKEFTVGRLQQRCYTDVEHAARASLGRACTSRSHILTLTTWNKNRLFRAFLKSDMACKAM